MKYAYTAIQAKAIDTHAIKEMGVPSLVLMEKAALSVRSIMKKRIREDNRILILCGMGNNGGDGMAVARLLYDDGYSVCVCPVGNPDRMTEETKKQFEIIVNYEIPIVKPDAISAVDIIVDALFGIGLSSKVREPYAEIIRMVNKSGSYVYAIDIPSGVDATTGKVLGEAVRADETITMGDMKLGLILFPGEESAGKVWVTDIGFPKQSVQSVIDGVSLFDETDILRLPARKSYSNKGTYGRVLVIAGSETMCGACILAAKAVYSMGTGLVNIVTSKENRDVVLTKIPEVIVSDYDMYEEELAKADVIVVGPGMGISNRTESIMQTILKIQDKPVVIDGDALHYVKRPITSNFILTPHLKEMSRLTGESLDKIKDDYLGTAVNWAEKLGCILVMKDHHTIVSDGHRKYINISGNQGMACGGSGDVLAGTIGGLLANVSDKYEAARLGVFLHGCAGDKMVEEKGSYALCATDLLEGLMKVTKEADYILQKRG